MEFFAQFIFSLIFFNVEWKDGKKDENASLAKKKKNKSYASYWKVAIRTIVIWNVVFSLMQVFRNTVVESTPLHDRADEIRRGGHGGR